ncbi:MAG: Omp85 family outer membrane protein [Bacteroidia bacterium]
MNTYKLKINYKWLLISFIIYHLSFTISFAQQKDSTKLPFRIAKEKRMSDEELAQKKEGISVTGVPDLSSDPINGFGAGAEGSLFFNGKKTDPFFAYTPYRAQLNVALFMTTRLEKEAVFALDIPYIFNTKWRLRGSGSYDIDPNLLYFGVTEQTLNPLPNNASYSDYEKSLTGNKAHYNTYTKTEAVFNMSLERSFYEGRLRTLIGYELGSVDLSTPLNPNALMAQDAAAKKMVGFGNNIMTLAQVGLIYDTRDLETDPTKGSFAELTEEVSLVALGSQFNFAKTFFHYNLYQPILPKVFKRLIFAGRIAMGYTDGDAPLYEYDDEWSSEGSIDALGGGNTLRGYKQGRFVSRAIQFTNLELRYRFAQFKILKQDLAFSAVPLFDAGGVWDDLSRVATHLGNLRYSEGLGLRIAWNANTILRFDYALSQEDRQFFFSLKHAF